MGRLNDWSADTMLTLTHSRIHPDPPAKFERFMSKHLMPLALTDEPDILTQVGLGRMDEIIPHQQQRAVLKLFSKFSGMDAPEQVHRFWGAMVPMYLGAV